MTNPLFHLLHLSDPTLPIGGFVHSAGLETYVQKGVVRDKQSAKDFVTAQLSHNICYTDAAFVCLAYDAARQNDYKLISQIDEECTAVKLPREIREASQKLGTRFLKIFEPLCTGKLSSQYREAVIAKRLAGHYSIAFGIYSALSGLPKEDALLGFYYNAAVGMITNSVKLIPLGQQEGQEILFSLNDLINELIQRSMNPDRELIGFCCTGFDIHCMQHEQLYSRLYMS